MGLLFVGVTGFPRLEPAEVDNEAIGVAARVELLVHGTVAIEQELTDVREREGVSPWDALAGEPHSDIAKENIDVEDRGKSR